MTEFVYHGPMQGLTLHDAGGAVVWDGMLHPGKTYTDLPPDHPHVVSFVAGGLLVEPSAPAPKRRPPAEKET